MEVFQKVTTYDGAGRNDPAVRPSEGAPVAESSAPGPLETAEVWVAEAQVLSALRSDGRPLTLLQLRARTGVPVPELQRAIGRLSTSRSIRRLNTIVESFCLSGLD